MFQVRNVFRPSLSIIMGEQFTLEISNIRAFEVWLHHKDDPRLKYTEIMISDVFEVILIFILRD